MLVPFKSVLSALVLASAASAKVVEYALNLTSTYSAPDGVYREVYLVNGSSPGPLLTCDEGDYLSVMVYNNLPVPITVHWHGIHQKDTPHLDGAAGITQYPIDPGSSFHYNFTTVDQYGNFWYHAHLRARYQDGVYGAIYIKPKDSRPKPYSSIVSDPAALAEILEKDSNPTQLAVADWYKWTSDAILAREFTYGIDPPCIQSFLINGKGRIVCQDAGAISAAGTWRQEGVYGAAGYIPNFDSQGCTNITLINGFTGADQQALEAPGNSIQCAPSETDREVIYVNGSSYMVFDLSNMGGEMGVHFSIDSHPFWVVMVEGVYIEPQLVEQIYVGVGHRFLILVETNKEYGIYGMRFASYELAQIIEALAFLSYVPDVGQPFRPSDNVTVYQDIGGNLVGDFTLFNVSIASPFDTSVKPPTGAADHTIHLLSNRSGVVYFSLMEDGSRMSQDMEISEPVLWADPLPDDGVIINPGIKTGDLIDIILDNTNLIAHPIHLHGHNFYLISESSSENFPYDTVADAIAADYAPLNFNNPPYRDGYSVQTGGHIVLRFIADNPGAWMLHCHLNTHLMGGMGVVIIEDREEAIKKIPKSYIKTSS
ncbi:multicopper oxidase-domain-containing protein [Kockiozyma suomiensis]|uniref:multicopper oxidase-domain-containing protein n=1 Tax=Kockiozyma suomiensis TaxID=1337062 RepID=UPI00334418DC